MNIDYSHFEQIDIRVGTILEINDFKEARNASYKLKIDFGPLGVLNSSAQITKRYNEKELIGKQVVSVVNLGSKRIAGFKSECLVLGAVSGKDVILLEPESKIPNGQQVL
ncbi:MAG: tRNA-binding protein [Flavobacteriaceae bacterium]|nr:tRNA-binding protein [Flavobacteriaceae bacterium]MCY4266750.1 tRNA-binding protein [Flavobacteriaceae bacterium]MCY4297764.1 tRNA-binding protein [Flavobacteriaceae bacterium]